MSTPEASHEPAARLWTVLRSSPARSGPLELASIPTDVGIQGEFVRLALGPRGEPRVLLPLAPKQLPRGLEVGPAIQWDILHVGPRDGGANYLDLKCVVPELEKAFAEVVDEIVRRIGTGVESISATTAVFSEFRELLTVRPRTGVDRSVVAGLLGELLVLQQLLDMSPEAWRSWFGVDRDRHDFVNGGVALEVKTSTRPGTTQVRVHGFGQLEPPPEGSLHLLHVRLEADPSGPVKLEALAEEAISAASNPSAIRNALAELGCADTRDEEWNRHSFRLDSRTLYWVQEGFPRLSPSTVLGGASPAGLSAVSYSLDLGVADAFICDTNEFNALLTQLCK